MSMRRFAPDVTFDMPFSNSDLAGALDMERAREQPSLARWRDQGEENSRFLIDKMAPKFASLFSAWLQLR